MCCHRALTAPSLYPHIAGDIDNDAGGQGTGLYNETAAGQAGGGAHLKAGLQCHFTGSIQTAGDLLLDIIFVGRKESCFVKVFPPAKMFTEHINLSCGWRRCCGCGGAGVLHVEFVLELIEVSSQCLKTVKAVLILKLSVSTEGGTDGVEVC